MCFVQCSVLKRSSHFSIPIQSIATNGPSLVGGDDLLHAPFWSRRSRWMICVDVLTWGGLGPRANRCTRSDSSRQPCWTRCGRRRLRPLLRLVRMLTSVSFCLPLYSFLLPHLPFRLLLSLRLPFPLAPLPPSPSDTRSSPSSSSSRIPSPGLGSEFSVLPPCGLANASVCLLLLRRGLPVHLVGD